MGKLRRATAGAGGSQSRDYLHEFPVEGLRGLRCGISGAYHKEGSDAWLLGAGPHAVLERLYPERVLEGGAGSRSSFCYRELHLQRTLDVSTGKEIIMAAATLTMRIDSELRRAAAAVAEGLRPHRLCCQRILSYSP